MRVVLRQPKTGFYLQCSGEWTPERETAREFLSAVVAYWWAVEQKLIAEVWLALKDPRKDLACAKVSSVKSRPIVDCEHEDWSATLHSFLYNGIDVDLINFDYYTHGPSCELLAQAVGMDFNLDRNPQAKAASFRKNSPPLPSRH